MARVDRLTPIPVDEMLLEWAVAERHEWVDPPPAPLRKAEAGEAFDVRESETAISLFGRVRRRGQR